MITVHHPFPPAASATYSTPTLELSYRINQIFILTTMNVTQQQRIMLETVLPYATLKNLVYLSGALIIIGIAHSVYPTVRKFLSPLRHLAGPKNDSLFFGNLRQLLTAQQAPIHEDWLEKYGTTFTFRGFLSVSVVSPVSQHILTFVSITVVLPIIHSRHARIDFVSTTNHFMYIIGFNRI